ncbi:MAG: hypothetical protein II649_04535 [Kiritimatiellae bacterium]|nr:hypothetical protein [Kiritimatiellia bacterium]
MAILTNTIGYNAPGFVEGKLNFPGTRSTTTAKQFKKRLRDKSLLPEITTIWGDKLEKGSTEYLIPVLPLIETYATKPGDKVKYQLPKSSMERFVIGRERAWGIHVEQEDKHFSAFDIESPLIQEALVQMNEDIETEMLEDIPLKVASFNTGNNAGFTTRNVALGAADTPVTLNPDGTLASGQVRPLRYLQRAVNSLRQYKGSSGLTGLKIVCNVMVADALQADEKFVKADTMGDATSVIRGDVYSLGKISGAEIYVSNALPVYEGEDALVYPVYVLDKSAIAYHDEMKVDDRNMTDIDYWGTFSRSKLVYDWFLQYPERLAVGYVSIV